MYPSDKPNTRFAAVCHNPAGLAVCLLEALQSTITGVDDADIVVDRYNCYRDAQGNCGDVDGVRALLHTFEEVGGSDSWAGKVGNYRRRYTPQSAPVAAAAIEHAAELFYAHRIDTVADLSDALDSGAVRVELETGLVDIAGQPEAWPALLELTGLVRTLVSA